MKKLTLMFGALVMGFMITSCGNSVKDALIADIDAYFDQATAKLEAIDNAEDFLAYAEKMSDGSDIGTYLMERWDKDMTWEDIKLSEKDRNDILVLVNEKMTAYSLAEKEKALQLLGPAIDRFNAIIDLMYSMYQNNQRFDNQVMDDFLDVFNYINMFIDYDNVNDELEERLGDATDKMAEMTTGINQRIAEMYQ